MVKRSGFLKKVFLALLAFFGIGIIAYYVAIYPNYTVPIMMYHHVEPLDHHEANWVNPQNFERHMAFLKKNKYRIMTLSELVEMTIKDEAPPRHAVVITFDDGNSDNYHNAYPILKKFSIPATMFVPSAFIDKEGFLTAQNIKEMVSSGLVSVGSHTVNHEYLPPLNEEQRRIEIEVSKTELENLTGKPVEILAYPIGGFSDEIKTMVRNAGYKAACSTNRGYDRLNRDVYELKRIRFSNKDDSDLTLWWKLNGYYNLFRKAKNPF